MKVSCTRTVCWGNHLSQNQVSSKWKHPTVDKWASICICCFMYLLWYHQCLAATKDTAATTKQSEKTGAKGVFRNTRNGSHSLAYTHRHWEGFVPPVCPAFRYVPKCSNQEWSGTKGCWLGWQLCTDVPLVPPGSQQCFRNALSSILSHHQYWLPAFWIFCVYA